MAATSTIITSPVEANQGRIAKATHRSFVAPSIVGGILAILSLLTANPWPTVLSIGVALGLIFLLWRPGEPPVLLFACGVQYIQVTTIVHYANFAGATFLNSFGGPQLQSAVLLGLIGLLFLALGARIGMGKLNASRARSTQIEIGSVKPFTLFATYMVTLPIAAGLGVVAYRIAAITQLLLSVVTIKWTILFLLFYAVLRQRRNYGLLWAAIAIEFLIGLMSYFAEFKSVFFLLIVVLGGISVFWNLRRTILGAVICALLIVISIIWSAIKQDYRDFLTQGSASQEVVVPINQRIEKIADLTTDLTDQGFFRGVEALIDRVGYVTYFAMAIYNVPERIPYENGRLWRETVQHVFMPRLFFPNKPAIVDSERTSLYTGVEVAGEAQGTSISMGYMAESYIDFGPVGMFVPIFLLGMFYGLLYRGFAVLSRYKSIGFAVYTSVILFSACNFETSNIKLVGGISTCAIVATVFLMFGERPLARLIGLRRVS